MECRGGDRSVWLEGSRPDGHHLGPTELKRVDLVDLVDTVATFSFHHLGPVKVSPQLV